VNDLPNEKLEHCRATLPLFVRDLLCQWLSLQPDSACASSTALSSTFLTTSLYFPRQTECREKSVRNLKVCSLSRSCHQAQPTPVMGGIVRRTITNFGI